MLTVLGVDPGLTRCGIGVLSGSPTAMRLVAHDCVRTDAAMAIELRLLAVHDRLCELIEEHQPQVLAIERVLFQANVRTAMATGQAAGAAMLAGARAGIPVVAYSPNEVKLAVTGDGAADKDGVARMVVAQLGLAVAPRPADVTDALAVAITHLARSRAAVPARGSAAPVASSVSAATTWEAVIAGNPHLREAGGA